MKLSSSFECQAMSDEDFEDLIVEVLYQGEFCFLVDQERGFDNLHISIHARPNGQPWKFPLADLQTAIKHAVSELWRLRRVE
jgi:hypothetical protein